MQLGGQPETVAPVGGELTGNAVAANNFVRLVNVTKRFGSLVACDAISLDINAGEVLALLGENGAGKSTLMKALYGVYQPDDGQVLVDGKPVQFASPRDAMTARIGMVFQSFSLIPALSVRDNLALAWPNTPWHLGKRGRNVSRVLDGLNDLLPGIDPDNRVGELSVAEQQLVELAKVLNLNARLVILDEPTSLLTPTEAKRLHILVKRLTDQGVAVVFITHKLADIEAVADRVTVLRRGQLVLSEGAEGLSRTDMVTAMVGQSTQAAPEPAAGVSTQVPRLVLQNLSAETLKGRIAGIDISIGKGEIVGIAGVAGNGQSVLAEVVAGIVPASTGEVLLDGARISRRDGEPPTPLAVGYVPEEPLLNGVAPGLSNQANLGLRELGSRRGSEALHEGSHALRRQAERRVAELLETFDVRPAESRRLTGTLSGGNLQKLVLARETGEPRSATVLVFPTMGLDVAATQAVYRRMVEAAAQLTSFLWISEEIDDLLQFAHRIGVMRGGQLVGVYENDGKLTREKLGNAMTGDAS